MSIRSEHGTGALKAALQVDHDRPNSSRYVILASLLIVRSLSVYRATASLRFSMARHRTACVASASIAGHSGRTSYYLLRARLTEANLALSNVGTQTFHDPA